MLRNDWNALRPGDRVMVHDTSNDGAAHLVAGSVVSVESTGGSNDIAVKVADRGGSRIVHPSRLSVHHDPIEFDGHCWRCTSGDPQVAKRRGA